MGVTIRKKARSGVIHEAVALSQAERIIARFGGARRLYHALKEEGKSITPSTIYRWTYPISKGGTGGTIPPRIMPLICKAARSFGLIIPPEDWDPRNRTDAFEKQLLGADIFF